MAGLISNGTYVLGAGGQSYTSPNETITVDNTNGTLEATKYAMAEVQGEEVEETMVESYMPYSASVGALSVIFVDNNNATITTPITYEFPATNWLFEPTDFAIKVGNTIIPMVNIKSDNPESVYSSINLKINERAPYKDIYGLLYEGFSITLSGDNIGKSVEIEMALRDATSNTDVYNVTKKYNESSIEKIELQEKLEPMQLVAGPGVEINVDEENRQINLGVNIPVVVNESIKFLSGTTNLNASGAAGANKGVVCNLNVNIPDGYKFGMWSHLATSGWVGAVYPEHPSQSNTNVWCPYAGSDYNTSKFIEWCCIVVKDGGV